MAASLSGALFVRDTHKVYPRFVRGEHIYLYDETGNKYIDGTSGTVIVNIGHGRTEIAEVMASQAEKLAFASPVVAVTEPAEKLAERIVSLAPSSFTKVWYQTSGSEAIEAGIKLARQVHVEAGRPSKYLIISRWQSYHGTTLGSLSATGDPPRRAPFQPLLQPFPHITAPNCYRCPLCKSPDSCGLACARELEQTIRQIGPSEISAFIAEPIVGSGGGVLVPPRGYYEMIRETCDKYNVFWIVDEVMTGFWRTGPTFAFQHWSSEPDVIVFAKGVTSGYAPLAGLIVQQRLFDVIHQGSGTFRSAGTLAGNPVACAVGLKVLDLMEQEKIPERVNKLEDCFVNGLQRTRKLPIVGDVRGKGLLAAIEFVQDKKKARPFPVKLGVYRKVVGEAYKQGLIIYGGNGIADGIDGDIVMVAPPLTSSKKEIEEIIDRLTTAIEKVSAELNG